MHLSSNVLLKAPELNPTRNVTITDAATAAANTPSETTVTFLSSA